MNYRFVEHAQNSYVETLAGDGRITSENEALDLISALGEYRTGRLMIHADTLTDEFFHLRTGLAGEVLQKFANYHVKVAAVLTPELVNQGRFREMALEANRSNRLFHIFYTREEAEAWLVQ